MSKHGLTVLRGIGRYDLVALMVNITLGAGMLGLPASIFALTNVYGLVVLALCAALMGVVAICFAEVGSRFADSGGPYLIARTALGPAAGFIVGWLYWVSRVLTFATICNLLVAYAARFVPAFEAGAPRAGAISVIVGAITLVHLAGIRHATLLGNALTALKVAFLGIFAVAALVHADALPALPAQFPGFGQLSDAMLLTVFAFVGFEAALVSTGETREPRRDIPFAIGTALLVVLLLYLGVQLVCMETVPALASSATPLADAAVSMWGPAGAQLTAAGAIIIMLGSLSSGFLATTRLPFAFAEHGDLPATLARVHARFRTPHIAIVSSAAVVLIATLASSFLSAITLATSTRMIVYAAGCAALILLRRRSDVPQAGFVAPLGPAWALLGIVLCLALLASASGRELTQLAIAAALGALVLTAQRLTHGRR